MRSCTVGRCFVDVFAVDSSFNDDISIVYFSLKLIHMTHDTSFHVLLKLLGLYVINLDASSGRDVMSRQSNGGIKVYGAYWSVGPDAVNKIAIDLWTKLGVGKNKWTPRKNKWTATNYDYEAGSNLDGRHTREGECYEGYYQSMPMAMNVYKVKDANSVFVIKLHQRKLMQKCLGLVGVSVGGSSIPIDINSKSLLKGEIFVLTGTFTEVNTQKQKSHELVTQMLESAGAKVNVRMTKKTNYLLAGVEADEYVIRKTERKFTHIQVVNLDTIYRLLMGVITLEDMEEMPSLTKDDFKEGAYKTATIITKLGESSDMEVALDELKEMSWQRDSTKMKPLYEVFGYPEDEKQPAKKKQKIDG